MAKTTTRATKKKGTTTEALASELRVGVGLLLRPLRQAPTGDDLTLPEGSALARLDRYGPSTASELAKREQISPQSMGATTAALEARGLVERTADPDDGRRPILSPTGAGSEAAARPPKRKSRADGRRSRRRVQRRGAGAATGRRAADRAARP